MQRVMTVLRIFLIVGIPIAVALSVFFFLKSCFLNPAEPEAKEKFSFMVKPGSNFTQVSEQLLAEKYVKYSFVPKLIVRLKNINTKTIKAGEYELSRSMTPFAIIQVIASGNIVKRKVTVIEGMTIRDVARVVASAGLISEVDFWRALHDTALLRKWGVPGDSFEGYLYPETYFFSLPVKAEDIIGSMIKEGEKIWPEEFTRQAERLLMSRHDVLTIASIIEKESGDAAEQPLISSVFHNRLNRGMKLQADPTVIYGIENFNGNLSKADLERPSPYNTYTNDGLPKGPIGNPGKNAIYAALHPVQSDYFYFVADGTGKHTFSVGLSEHNKAVAQFVDIEKEKAKADNMLQPNLPESTPTLSGPSLRPMKKAPGNSFKQKR